MDRHTKLITIGKCLDRYENILRANKDFASLNAFAKGRFDHLIDLDVSNINVAMLACADDGTFMHDMNGVFENIVRNTEDPSASTLDMFVPRVGFLEVA